MLQALGDKGEPYVWDTAWKLLLEAGREAGGPHGLAAGPRRCHPAVDSSTKDRSTRTPPEERSSRKKGSLPSKDLAEM